MNVLTVDVEDWFHILEVEGTPNLDAWAELEGRVEASFRSLLDLFSERETRVTCFFLGWVAERHPELVREAAARGHEIASHGYAHQLVYTQTREAFREDLLRAKAVLEDACGAEVRGYRAPGFSITPQTPWAFEEIARAGYTYDSSVFPGERGHGGFPGAPLGPHKIETPAGELVEFPVTVVDAGGGRRLCVFGGGYLRITPYPVIRLLSRVVERSRPVVYYVHPREVDPGHPRLPMSRARRFKSYVNLRSTRGKLRKLIRDSSLGTFAEWIERNAADLRVEALPSSSARAS